MASKHCSLTVALSLCACAGSTLSGQAPRTIPITSSVTLSGEHLTLPKDFNAQATVLILGFGRNSQEATTAWERPTRTQLARAGLIGFYDMAMLAEIPSIMRPLIVRAIKHKVPDVLQANFIPLTDGEEQWKRAAGYLGDQPDAAYVMLVDKQGMIRWNTHSNFSSAAFAELRRHAEDLARAVD